MADNTSIIPDTLAPKKKDQFGNPIDNTTTAYNPGAQPGTVPPPQTPSAGYNYGQLPYQQEGQDQVMPLTKEATGNVAPPPAVVDPTAAGTTQGDTQVLAKAQESVLNQGSNPLDSLVNQKTQDLLTNPNGGLDTTSYAQNQLSQYDRQQSAAMEAARQKLGNTSQSGELQNDFLKNALTAAQGRSDLQNKVNYDLSNLTNTNAINALAQGRATQQQDIAGTTSGIQNLATVRGMAEGEATRTADAVTQANDQAFKLKYLSADQAGQTALTDLQGKIASGAQLTAFDFQSSQASLDRALKTAMQTNDLAGQKDLIAMKGQIDAQAQAADQAFKMKYLSADQAGQADLTKLQGDITKGNLLTTEDFSASQAALDRALKVAQQSNDIQGQKDILAQKATIDAQAQTSQNDFTTKLTAATQSWQSNERVSTETFQANQAVLDKAQQVALQNGDIAGQEAIANTKAMNDMKMQTASMNHDQSMAYLNSQLADAKANNDVNRQKDILSFQSTQTLNQMYAASDIKTAEMNVQADIDKSIKAGDYAQASAMQEAQFAHDSSETALNRTIEQQKVDLQGKQIDLNGQQMTFDQITQGVDKGLISADSGSAAIQAALKANGVTVQASDPLDDQKAIAQQWTTMQYQYALSHPGDANLGPDGKVDMANPLKETAVSNFNNWQNKISDPTSVGTDPADVAAAIIKNPANYQGKSPATDPGLAALVNGAAEWPASGKFTNNTNRFDGGTPASGSAFKLNNIVYIATSGVQVEKGDIWSGKKDTQYINAVDPSTGYTVKIYSGGNVNAPQPSKQDAWNPSLLSQLAQ